MHRLTEGSYGVVYLVFGLKLYRGTSPTRKRPPPWDPHRTLGIGLR